MAVTSGHYGLGLKDTVCGTIDLQGDVFGFMLVNSGNTVDADAHRFRSEVTGEVATGSGYTYGGATITGNTVSYDAASNEIRWDWNDPAFTSASFSCTGARIFRRNGGTSAADELVLWVEFGGTETVTSGTFSYVVPATGAAAITWT